MAQDNEQAPPCPSSMLAAALETLDSERARQVLVAVDRLVSARLRDAEKRMLVAQEAGGIGTYEVCFISQTTTGSPRFFEIFGQDSSHGHFVNGDWIACLHPDDRARLLAELRQNIVERLTRNEFEYRIVLGGETRWVRSCDRMEFDARGRAVSAVGAVQDITERKRADELVWRAAYHDTLTGLPNRLLFGERLELLLKADGGKVALLMLDLDRLKEANDAHGHAAGDHLIRAAGERLSASAPQGATMGRLGGDEFALAAPVACPRAVGELGETLARRMGEPLIFGSAVLEAGTTVGTAFAPAVASDPDGLMRAADVALCVAKLTARGGCLGYYPGMERELRRLTERRTNRPLCAAVA